MNNLQLGSFDINAEKESLHVLPVSKTVNVQLFKPRSQYLSKGYFWRPKKQKTNS